MSTETTKKKIKIDNGTNYAYAYTDKAIDAKIPTDINVDADGFAILEHDGTEITGQKKKVKFAQMNKAASFNEVTIPTASSLKTADGTGLGLNILSLNLKDCMNESDYNELVGYVLQQAAIAKTYNITLPNLTGVDAVKFTTETPLGNMTQIFYRNSKTITQFNWLCNWTNNDNFMEMITITGLTDEDVNVIKYIGIEQVDITDMPTDLKATTTNLSLLADSAKIGSGINLSGFEYDEATNTLKASGGTSPCLNLLDPETQGIRTSITEEEKNNLDKGLYNSVYYYDESWGENAELSMMLPQLLTKSGEMYIATIYTGLVSEDSGSISGLLVYIIQIGEKSTDGTYPIEITEATEIPFAAGGGEVRGGVVKSLPFPQTINSEKGYNLLSPIIDAGEIVYAGNAVTDNNLGNFKLILGLSSNVVPYATGEQEYCNFDCIVKDMGIGRMSLKKDANNIPQFKSFTTWLPPITAADEGKSLVVKNGNGQWATIDTSNYGKLDALSSNDWNSSNVFRGVTTLHSPVIVGGISSDGGGDQILIDRDLSEDFGSLFKRVTGFVSTYQTPTSVAFEALGFINENAFGDLSKASVLSFVSMTGKSQWIEPSTNTKYNYQLPKKSGTIALTSDLSEAGTSVTIRRW